jgi:hypothetical protein
VPTGRAKTLISDGPSPEEEGLTLRPDSQATHAVDEFSQGTELLAYLFLLALLGLHFERALLRSFPQGLLPHAIVAFPIHDSDTSQPVSDLVKNATESALWPVPNERAATNSTSTLRVSADGPLRHHAVNPAPLSSCSGALFARLLRACPTTDVNPRTRRDLTSSIILALVVAKTVKHKSSTTRAPIRLSPSGGR